MKKQKFDNELRKYEDAGYITKIYSSDKLCVCNIANSVYAVFNYTETNLGQWGFMVVPENVRAIVEDNDLFSELVSKTNKNILNKMSIFLNDIVFLNMKKLKEQTDLNGPSKDIDFEMEEEIMAKNKSK